MPLFPVSPSAGAVPVYNSACPWASSAEDLEALYSSKYTAAVTTRTATLNGFADDQTKHQVRSPLRSFMLRGCGQRKLACPGNRAPLRALRPPPFTPAHPQVAFFGPEAQSTSNSYGYSPYTLETYLGWLAPLLGSSTLPRKQVIVSITGTVEETKTMLVRLQQWADEFKITVGVEFNASCPNFKG